MNRSESPFRSIPRVAIVGAGISGLSAAFYLRKQDPNVEVVVFDKSLQVGGILQTVERDGFLIERSADNFITKMPWAEQLCKDLGIADQLLPTNGTNRRAAVVARGKLCAAPEGFVLMAPKKLGPMLRSPLLSWAGKLRLCLEPFIRRRNAGDDESVGSFARRRVGRETFARLVQPLLSGIYTADPERLSMNATMPQYVEQEREHGSLIRAAKQANSIEQGESGARYSLFVAPRGGMRTLVEAAANSLPAGSLRLGTAVQAIRQSTPARWEVVSKNASGGDATLTESFDAIVIATPTYHASGLLSHDAPELAEKLKAVEYAGATVVCLGVHASQIREPIDCFGFVVPAIEGRRIIAASFSSQKFPGRAPDGQVLIRVFVGGALQAELANLPDAELLQLAREELGELIGLSGEPICSEIARWPQAMPQYHLGHLDRVEEIEKLTAEVAGLELAGNAYRGVGVPQCVRSGKQAAERTLAYLGSVDS